MNATEELTLTSEVKREARGRWGHILNALGGSDLGEALSKPGKHVFCPFHQRDGGKRRQRDFRAYRDVDENGRFVCTCNKKGWDGFAILMELNNWSFPEARDEVAKVLGFEVNKENRRFSRPEPARRIRKARPTPKADPEWLREKIRETWDESVPLWHEKAEVGLRYLYGRGIRASALGGLEDVLRVHPALGYYEDGKCIARMPALVAKFSDAWGDSVSCHRIYLTPEGRNLKNQDGMSVKKLMSPPEGAEVMGGAIHLGPASPVLGVAEGVETALSVYTATGYITWSLYSASVMEAFVPPQGVQELVIWADNDVISGAGMASAKVLKQRMWQQGIMCSIMLPPLPQHEVKNWDWNDVLQHMGVAGFPNITYWRQQQQRQPLPAAG